MLASTHRIISSIICDCLRDKGIFIDERKFSWGSVKPDFALPPFRRKHYMDETLEYVADCILQAVSSDLKSNQLSEKVGEVTHFLTDFFCLPHSERWDFIWSGRTIEHIVYEHRLHDYAVRYFGLFSPVTIEFNPDVSLASVCEWIVNNHELYQSRKDYLHDLGQASGISLAVTRWILSKRSEYMYVTGSVV